MRALLNLLSSDDDGTAPGPAPALLSAADARRLSAQRQRELERMILLADTSTPVAAADDDTSPAPAPASSSGGAGRSRYDNFSCTGATAREPNDSTPEAHGKKLRVCVLQETEGASPSVHAVSAAMQTLQAPAHVPSSRLDIPYRSMSTTLHLMDGGTAHKIHAVCDSGAAQCGISLRYLRRHPELYETRQRSTHRFHGITGEPLATDGVVRLTLRMGGHHCINVWAHVFTHMHSDMLLGTNAIVENALTIDGGDLKLCIKDTPGSCVPLQYKLDASGSDLRLLQGQADSAPTCVYTQRMQPTGARRFAQVMPVHLNADVTLLPHCQLDDNTPQALQCTLAKPLFGPETQWWLEPSSYLTAQHPELDVVSNVVSSRNLIHPLMAANNGSEPITLRAGQLVGYATKFRERDYFTSNEEGEGILSFDVQLPQALQPTEVTIDELREQRGLDLRDCRDLGAPGSPLLSEEQRRKLEAVFLDEHEAIAVDPKRPGNSDYMLIHLNTADAPPQASKPYGIPYAHQEAVRKEIEKLLKYSLVSPCSSAWAAPILVVVKKDSTADTVNIKLATDLRKLNAVTEMDAGAIGEMAEIIDKFRGKPYASCCDVSSGYYSFRVHPDSREKLAFVLPMSMGGTTFCWNRAPYGVARLPAEFSRAMMTILKGLHEDVTSYLDDITAHTSTFDQHCYALRQVLRRMRAAGITLKGSKCLILPPRLELLGYDITPAGVHMQHKKANEFAKFTVPQSRDDIQKWLGAVLFYRRWIPHLSTLTAPMTDLLKKGRPFKWSEQHQLGFDTITQILTSDKVMGFPDLKDPKAKFWVFTDASDVGVAGILMQLQKDPVTGEYKPVTLANFSKVFNDTQRNWAIYEKESCALMLAVTQWRKYLLGREFLCFVDSTVALSIMSKQRHTSKMQRWGMLMQEYLPGMQMAIKKSEENGAADALSRRFAATGYVKHPSDELELDDSLYDRLYSVDTVARGTFGLYQPKEPLNLAKLWGVGADMSAAEIIAMTNVQVAGPPPEPSPDAKQLLHILQYQQRVGRGKVDQWTSSPRLLTLEQEMCALFLDPLSNVATAAETTHAQATDHYGLYVQAFEQMHQRRPIILCNDANIELGIQLAGCDALRLDHQSMNIILTQEIDAAHLILPSAVSTQAPIADAVNACFFRHAIDGRTVPAHLDQDGCVVAANFVLGHDCDANSMQEWRHSAQRIETSEDTEHSTWQKCRHLPHATRQHGQLLAGQLVAAALHANYAMPIIPFTESGQHPAIHERLEDWALNGYGVPDGEAMGGDSAECDSADDVFDGLIGLVAAQLDHTSDVRVLRRQVPLAPAPVPSPRVYYTWEQRMHRYQDLKERLEAHQSLRTQGQLEPYPLSNSAVDGAVDSQIPPSQPLLDEPSPSPFRHVTPEEQQSDPALAAIADLLTRTAVNDTAESRKILRAKQSFVLDQGLLKHRAVRFTPGGQREVIKVVVPWHRRQEMLTAYHTLPMYGHRGHQTLYELISKRWYWAGLYSDCVDFVSRCEVCAVRKSFRGPFVQPAKAIPTPPRPFHSIAIDIKGPIATSNGNHSYILVVVCLLTRFVVAVPLVQADGATIARALVDHVFSVHSCPYSMQVDNANYFTGTTLTKLTELYGIRHVKVLPWQPTSNGSAESVVKKISQGLYRHCDALRDWDRKLQLVVHGFNCSEHPSTGVSPFFALFGRDPVGLAELDWPDLERLDTDGDTFVSSLAGEIRKIWTEIKEASDASKRAAAVLANKNQPKVIKPLQPGDYVFVEYGDDKHSKRLGKAGLPRRRRFKVLEYNPERGYVRIDTDGLRLLDKVSLNKVSRAPRYYSVQDFSTPITTAERKGGDDLALPPEWRKEVRHGKTRDYVVYVGPGGRGVANSVLQAWREHGGDAAFMPQPAAPGTKNALTYPLPVAHPKLTADQLVVGKPPQLTRAFVDALLAELDTMLSAGQSSTRTWARWKITVTVPPAPSLLPPQSSDMFDRLKQIIGELKAANVDARRHVQGWQVIFKPRVNDPTQGDWYATSPGPNALTYRSMNRLREALLGVQPAPAAVTWTVRSPDGRNFVHRDELLALAQPVLADGALAPTLTAPAIQARPKVLEDTC